MSARQAGGQRSAGRLARPPIRADVSRLVDSLPGYDSAFSCRDAIAEPMAAADQISAHYSGSAGIPGQAELESQLSWSDRFPICLRLWRASARFAFCRSSTSYRKRPCSLRELLSSQLRWHCLRSVMRMSSIELSSRSDSIVRIFTGRPQCYPRPLDPGPDTSPAQGAERHPAVPIDRRDADRAVNGHGFLEGRLNVHEIRPSALLDWP